MVLRCVGLGLTALVVSVSFGGDAVVEQILTELEPSEAMVRIDSLQGQGILSRRDALALKAQVLNRPGYLTSYGTQTGAFFDEALAAFSNDTLSSQGDSAAYYTLLLDFAYFNARARFAADSVSQEEYGQVEEDCLRRVQSEARLNWQVARAALELGRLNRFRSSVYGESNGSRYDVASEYLQLVLQRYAGTVFVNEALWHLAGLQAETGRTDEAQAMLTLLERRATGTKWEGRAQRLRSLISRQELFIDSIAKDGSKLVIGGQARNIKGTVHMQLDRAHEIRFERTGRLPFAGEDAAWSTRLADRLDIDAGRTGAVWQSSLSFPEAGFYRLTASFGDTTITCTLGVWDMEFDVALAGTLLSIHPTRKAHVVVSINDEGDAWRVLTARDACDGELVTCDLPAGHSFQVYLTDGAQSGWSGPGLWSPCFEVWTNTRSVPAPDQPETG